MPLRFTNKREFPTINSNPRVRVLSSFLHVTVYFDFFSQNPHMLVFCSPSGVKTMLYIHTNILQILLSFLLGISLLSCGFYNHLSWGENMFGPKCFPCPFQPDRAEMVNNEVSSRPFINRNEESVMFAKRTRMLRRGRLYVSVPSCV